MQLVLNTTDEIRRATAERCVTTRREDTQRMRHTTHTPARDCSDRMPTDRLSAPSTAQFRIICGLRISGHCCAQRFQMIPTALGAADLAHTLRCHLKNTRQPAASHPLTKVLLAKLQRIPRLSGALLRFRISNRLSAGVSRYSFGPRWRRAPKPNVFQRGSVRRCGSSTVAPRLVIS
jgi:hypothetical protein